MSDRDKADILNEYNSNLDITTASEKAIDTPKYIRLNKYMLDTLTSHQLLNRSYFGKVRNPTYKHTSISPLASTTRFLYPEYNFSEIITITETESLIARAFQRKESLALKEGWDFVGKNPKTVQYIKTRLHEIAHVSRISTYELINSMVVNLTRFSNWFAAVTRSSKYSTGKIVNLTEKAKLQPIAGFFPIAPETVLLEFNKLGEIIAIAQDPYMIEKRKVFRKHKYLHFKINDLTGYSIGVPLLIPVRDDISALRRLEENVEILLYQHLFPIVVYQVGTEKAPAKNYPDGSTELDVVTDVYSELPREGAIVIPERHKLDILNTHKAGMDVEPFLKYYKKRILSGIGISSLDIGEAETANRSTSDSLSVILIDGVKHLQRNVESQFNELIIKELLLESTFADLVNDPDSMVYLKFKEIDVEYIIKKENHTAQMYSQHMVTHKEARSDIGREEWTDEDKQDSFLANVTAFKAEASQNGTETNVERGEKSGEGRDKPSNQHGQKLTPTSKETKFTLDSLLKDISLPSIEENHHSVFYNDWNNFKNKELINSNLNVLTIFDILSTSFKKDIAYKIQKSIYSQINNVLISYGKHSDKLLVGISNKHQKQIELYSDLLVEKILSSAYDLLKNKSNNLTNKDVLHLLDSFVLKLDQVEKNRIEVFSTMIVNKHLSSRVLKITYTEDTIEKKIFFDLYDYNYSDLTDEYFKDYRLEFIK